MQPRKSDFQTLADTRPQTLSGLTWAVFSQLECHTASALGSVWHAHVALATRRDEQHRVLSQTFGVSETGFLLQRKAEGTPTPEDF